MAILISAALASIYLRRRRTVAAARAVCHPSLSHLIDVNRREVLLIGALPLDLDAKGGPLVKGALSVLKPDVVMVEGTWAAGLNAMMFSGSWELHGVPPPSAINWTGEGQAVTLLEAPPPRPSAWRRRLGFEWLRMPRHLRESRRSMVPLKVRSWSHRLRGAVGGDVAAALVAAASSGVPVHFLGPTDGGLQGHALVARLAEQASRELLEEEGRRGEQLQSADLDSALLRAESRVRADAGRWQRDVRTEAARTSKRVDEHLAMHAPELRAALSEQLELRNAELTAHIVETMEEHRKSAVIVSIDQWTDIEERLLQVGYSFVSQCA